MSTTDYVISIERIETKERPSRYQENEIENFEDRQEVYHQRIDTLGITKLKKIIEAVNEGGKNE